ncbi:Aft1 HRR domain-containing protein [Elsinoe australis]|uniref:Aft1 HRR domain-containing protein n=1 Tax=Elsinoe australis TaxID=40998 RepID=A0A4U7AU76_9PEZI|nr:Aft1 HRR domain-containing protein [Elsinoe australis]
MSVATQRMSDNLGKTMPSPQTKKSQLKSEDNQKQIPSIVQPDDVKEEKKEGASQSTNAPLAPPPRPSQAGENNNNQDYFGQNGQKQEGKDYFNKEPNPFESAFGAPSDTPGKPQLPGVGSLTSPAPLLGGTTPGWPGSLRSGPLSPAMLTGPTNNDYFNSDHHFAGSFPTPNESSLRTGLTPGGGGSMFPQPSPNSQAMFNAIQSGGATPGTLDFHRTAMHARAANQGGNNFNMPASAATSQPQDANIQPNLDSKSFPATNNQHNQQNHREQFEQHDANDAANGLFMLAQSRGGNQQQGQQYPPPQQASQMNYMSNAQHMNNQGHSNEASPTVAKRGAKGSIGSNISGSTQNEDGFSESGMSDSKPATRNKGKKGNNAKGGNNRRKAEETPSKASNKRQKGNGGNAVQQEPDDMPSDDEDEPQVDANGKKLTDEEKRKNFLERNRIAALKCRQRKKQWLANLQQKVEIYSTENDALAGTVTQLREEIVGLKTLLLAHKDCPVSQAQGISGMAMQNIAGDAQGYGNPYGMGMPQGMGQHGMPGQPNMQRR